MSNVVYYIGVKGDGHVKIGTTKNLSSRLSALAGSRPDGHLLEVLATEPGSYDVEQSRHRQFAATRGHGEWFTVTPELQAHIDQLAARSHPSYVLGYDEGYMSAINDRQVVKLIRCIDCEELAPPAYQRIDEDEEHPQTCGLCYGEVQDAIAIVEAVGWVLMQNGLGWTRGGFNSLPVQLQRRLLIIAERDLYPDQDFKTMMLEVIG